MIHYNNIYIIRLLKYIIVFNIIIVLLIFCIYFYSENDKVNKINPPKGFQKVFYDKDSFPFMIKHLPLKKINIIRFWNNKLFFKGFCIYNTYGVIDVPLYFNEDLEQCADFAMRFWSDYHLINDRLDKLELFDFNGNRCAFRDSDKSYLDYLHWHMGFSNSYSIKEGGIVVDPDSLQPGDMLVQNNDGKEGHVSIIMDVAENDIGDKVYLIGYGNTPAQQFHIEKAGKKYGIGGWFTLPGYRQYLHDKKFNKFGPPVFRRFK